jgi:hypothetical protein
MPHLWLMAERRRRPTREELDERLRNVLDRIPESIEADRRPAPDATVVALAPRPEPANGNGATNGHPAAHANGNGTGRVVSGTIKAAGEG